MAAETVTQRVARRIGALRQRRGLTQEALAERAQVNRVTIARLERARHQPTLETVDRIARALGTTLVALVR